MAKKRTTELLSGADRVLVRRPGYWRRRYWLTVPLYYFVFVIMWPLLPLMALAAVTADIVRRTGKLGVTRIAMMVYIYFTVEVIGLTMAFGAWFLNFGPLGGFNETYLRRHYAIQRWWSRNAFEWAQVALGFKVVVEGAKEAKADRGPFFLFLRHVSIADTLLPAQIFANPHKVRLRYVMKKELLWDPALDVAGNRLPNVFVDRGSTDSAKEIAAVATLAQDMGAKDAVLIYPEGTRFTPEKRDRVLEKLAEHNDKVVYEKAKALTCLLPPRLGGPLALLDNNADGADVVFMAHVGFDRCVRFEDLVNGSLIGTTVRVKLWRIPFAEIPTTHHERVLWLFDQWKRMDDWVRAKRLIEDVEPVEETEVA